MVNLSILRGFNLLKLYQNDIVKRLTPLYLCKENAQYLEELLPLNKLDELISSSENEDEFGSNLWASLRNSPMNHALYNTVLNYLYKVDPDLHSFLSMFREQDRRSHFTMVLDYLDEFIEFTNVDTVINYLMRIPQYVDPVIKLEVRIKDVQNERERKIILLRTVPLFGSGAMYDILKGVYMCGAEAQKFVNRLVPNFLRFYEMISADRLRPIGLVQMCDVNTSVKEFVAATESVIDPRFSPHAVDLKWENLSSHQTSSVSSRIINSIQSNMYIENPIVLRDYQKELCAVALSWQNTIICAPTGSGKTIVSANIIKTFLMSKNEHGRNPKVLFLIPNTFILEQQASTLRKYLMHSYKVLSTCGSDNIVLRPAIDANDVVVTTPQMIVNLLKNIDSGDMERPTAPFRLNTFGMIFFDETHATKKESPYNKIMQQYHRDKFSGKLLPGEKLPQIIGLTASLGVGDAKTDTEALQHITEICANMDCKSISIVKVHVRELREFSPITPDEVVFCPNNSDLCTQFRDVLVNFMTQIEISIREAIASDVAALSLERFSSSRYSQSERQVSSNSSYQNEVLTDPPSNKESQAYSNWLYEAKRKHIPEYLMFSDLTKTLILKKLDVLEVLYNGLTMLSNFPSQPTFTTLCEQLDEFKTSNVMDKETKAIWERNCVILDSYTSDDCAIVSELVRQLCLQHSTNSDFRAIVFVQTRDFCKILSDLLINNSELIKRSINTEYITGLNAKTERCCSRIKQEEKLKRFAVGTTRCLIATSVAEEGLDIAKCNLVIKYNYATNEIAHVQRRGRGRAENSRCLLLTSREKLLKQEETNIQKEELMNKVLDYIYIGNYPLERKVEHVISQLQADIQKLDAELEFRESVQSAKNIVFNIRCIKCSTFMCVSKDIKCFNDSQYCVSDPLFWKKVSFKEIMEVQQYNCRFDSLYQLFCMGQHDGSTCGNCIGRVVKVNNGNMPVLSASKIKLEWIENGQRHFKALRKWKQIRKIYFTPELLRSYDIINMATAAEAPAYSTPIFNLDEKLNGKEN